MKGSTFLAILGTTIVLILLGSSLYLFYYVTSLDLNVLRAEPYVDEILFEDSSMKELAAIYTKGCTEDDASCLVNKVYREVVTRHEYELDPNGTEVIRSPFETLSRKRGDCEDLAILAASLLENLNVTTYLVLTSNHAYALACGIEQKKLLDYSETSMKEAYAAKFDAEADAEVFFEDGEIYSRNNYQDLLRLGPGEISYVEGSKKYASFNLEYGATSSRNFEFYVLPSIDDVHKFAARNEFNKFDCELEDGGCDSVSGGSVIMIYNPTDKTIEVDVNYNFIYPYDSSELFSDSSYAFYNIEGETCVVLETTAGKYGYVGFTSDDLVGEKQAFNPRTYEYFLLA